MTGPMLDEKPKRPYAVVKANVQKLIDAGADDDEINGYLDAEGYGTPSGPITPGHSKFTPAQLIKRAEGAVTDAKAEEPSYAERALGGIASLVRDIPGAEAAQAYTRAITRGKGGMTLPFGGGTVPVPAPGEYTKALDDIRGAEASAPALVRNFNRLAGGGAAAAAIPGGVALSGARFGIAHGALQADPASLEDRLHDAALEGSVAPVLKYGTPLAGKATRFALRNSVGVPGRALRVLRNLEKTTESAAKRAATTAPSPVASAAKSAEMSPDAVARQLEALGVPPEKIASAVQQATRAPTTTPTTWTEFLKQNMGPAMREHGSHGAAIKALGAQWRQQAPNAAARASTPVRTLDEAVSARPTAPVATPAAEAPISREAAQRDFQTVVDKYYEASPMTPAKIAARKGVPLDPPDDPDLMQQLAASLQQAAKGKTAKKVSPAKKAMDALEDRLERMSAPHAKPVKSVGMVRRASKPN